MYCGIFLKPLFLLIVFHFVRVIKMDENSVERVDLNKTMDDIDSFDSDTYCKFQANSYRCTKRTKFSYYYDVEKNTCEPFNFGNCLHPYNVFDSLKSCKSECKDSIQNPLEKDVTENIFCRFQPQFGDCNSYYPKWYFDITEMRCRGFSFSGCGGNSNRFNSKTECMDVCGQAIKHCANCIRYFKH